MLAAQVARQATALNASLQGIDDGESPLETLAAAGARLLDLLTSESSLAINRAALADQSGALSRILVEAGRNQSVPLIVELLDRVHRAGLIAFADAWEACRLFYGLLIADRQILVFHGVPGTKPAKKERCAIAGGAAHRLRLLLPQCAGSLTAPGPGWRSTTYDRCGDRGRHSRQARYPRTLFPSPRSGDCSAWSRS
jgi:hypothetical protein